MRAGAEVKAKKETAEHVSQEQMTERGDTNLLEAIRWVPGIVTNTGHNGYDTGGFGIRGYGGSAHSGDHLALFVDGVPMYDGYEGRIDYNSVLSGGLESISIEKGYNSVLTGPNNIGGTLNVRTAKPKKLFELSARTGFNFDAGGFAGNVDSVTIGTRLDKFYARAGFDGSFIDHWNLPDSFEPADDTPPEQGGNPQKKGKRLGSESTNVSARAMLGVTPIETLDIWGTYNFTFRDKGLSPPQAGPPNPASSNASYGLRVWPGESRHTASLHTEWTPERFYVNLHAYFDKADSKSISLSGGTGTTQERNTNLWNAYQNYLDTGIGNSASEYDKYTLGVNLEGGFTINDWNQIALSLQFRQLGETIYSKPNAGSVEHNDDNKTSYWKDAIYYGAVEYTISPINPITAVLGLGVDYWQPQDEMIYSRREYKLPDPVFAPQWAVGLFYDVTEQHELHLTYAKKHRFPGFYERTSPMNEATSSSGGIETINKANPGLKPQEMHNFELGYRGYFLDRIRVTTAVFMNYERNRFARVYTYTDDSHRTAETKNLDEFLYYGFEFGTEMFLNDYFTIGGALGVNRYNVLHSESDIKYMENIPELTTNGYISISPFAGINTGVFENIKVTPRFEYISAIDTTSVTATGTRAMVGQYTLVHIKISTDIAKHYSFSFAINNLTDELYYTSSNALVLSYPGAGRSFNISLGAKF